MAELQIRILIEVQRTCLMRHTVHKTIQKTEEVTEPTFELMDVKDVIIALTGA